MKRLIILAAMAATVVLLPSKAAATANPLLLNLTVSGTVEVWTNSYLFSTNKTETNITSSVNVSFNNKYIYNLISNSVAGAYGELGTNLTPTNLPANGYIAFNVVNADNPEYPYNAGSGTFYVTNKSGFFYRLSGYDAGTNYYSFIELDDDDFDFYDNFYGAYVGAENDKTSKGTYTEMEPSAFYVHDDPYSYDDGDQPSTVFSNKWAIEIRSNIKAIWTTTNGPYGVPASQSDSSTGSGCGTAMINANDNTAVTSGKITLVP
jgi:hypothetical protein